MPLFVQLDTAWPDNVKVIRVGLEGAGLHAIAMCIAKRTETDGVLHRAQLHRVGASDELIDMLLDEGLFDPVAFGSRAHEDPDQAVSFRVHDWHDRNPSQDAIAATRSAKAEAAQRGNHKRWKHEGDFEDCNTCQPNKPSVLASAKGERSQMRNGSDRHSHSQSHSQSQTNTVELDTFDEWWSQYPRKRGKQAAVKAYAKALKQTDAQTLLDAVGEAIHKEWRDRPADKIPHPATWLNEGRWEDELTDERPKPTAQTDTGGFIGGDW